MQVKNLTFARQEIVFDVEAVHGFEMAAQDSSRDEFGDGGGFAGGVLDGVECLAASLKIFLGFGVPLRDAGVEVPAVVVEARLLRERFDFDAGLLFDMREANDHVGDLHSGVVDVVLDVDFPARITQQTNEGVAEDGVAQVSDVGGFVGIDAGVLDQNLSRGNVGSRFLVGGEGGGHPGAVDFNVQVSRPRDREFGDAFDRTDLGANFFGNAKRSAAQRLGEGENRDGKVSQLDFRRVLNHGSGQGDAGVTTR